MPVDPHDGRSALATSPVNPNPEPRMDQRKRKPQLNVRLDPELLQDVRRTAAIFGLSIERYVANALRDYGEKLKADPETAA